jgi:hypothetical protein
MPVSSSIELNQLSSNALGDIHYSTANQRRDFTGKTHSAPGLIRLNYLHQRKMMSNKNGNYCAFYVAEPFNESALNAHATEDFLYYNLLRAWKGKDSAFPFNDSHSKTYSVRDGSDWESTLKPRLRERLRGSKDIVFFLSKKTINSRALREELDYGINTLELPVIVIYPGYDSKESLLDGKSLKQEIKNLWGNLPIFRDSAHKVPALHIPLNKEMITTALNNEQFMLNTKREPDEYAYRE